MRDWDVYYRDLDEVSGLPTPCRVLADYHYLLPREGQALDLACGLAGNAFFLARHGLQSSAWDSAATALAQVKALSRNVGIDLALQQRDVETHPPDAQTFDVIVVSRFLCRAVCDAIAAALRPGGLLFYQTYVAEKPQHIGPRNPAFLLQKNELLRLFADLRVLVYMEQGLVGDVKQSVRNEALLVACKDDPTGA